MFRRWGAIDLNELARFTGGLQSSPPSGEAFRNCYDEAGLLKSRDFGSLIHAPNHCIETVDSQKFRGFTKQ